MTYVVLGMHKSGTTLAAEILHRSGIPMVERISDADYESGNKWERASTLEFDKQILGARDVDSLSLDPPDETALLRAGHLEHARRLAESEDAGGEWGFKDPRACLVWPVWSRTLKSPKIVGVYRHYGAVVQHYLEHAARVHRTGPYWKLRVEWLALRRWCEYNDRLLDAVDRSEAPSILLSYERLMGGDEELERFARFVGRSLADPRRRSGPRGPRGRRAPDWRSRIGARAAQLAGAGSAARVWARLESTRAEQGSRAMETQR